MEAPIGMRTYTTQRYCPIARTLDVVGDRWCLLVLRDLFDGTSRFADLVRSLEGISPNVLSTRIKTLEAAGIIEHRVYSNHPLRAGYHLTPKGLALGPVLGALAEWGQAWEPEEGKLASD